MWACGVSIIDDSLRVTTTPGVARKFLKRFRDSSPGHVVGYGSDAITAKAKDVFRELFETDCETFFVFNGTAANSLAIGSFCSPHHSVLCHRHSHVESDECNAPGFLNQGLRIVTSGRRRRENRSRQSSGGAARATRFPCFPAASGQSDQHDRAGDPLSTE